MDKIYDDKPIVINETYVGYGKTDLSEMNKSELQKELERTEREIEGIEEELQRTDIRTPSYVLKERIADAEFYKKKIEYALANLVKQESVKENNNKFKIYKKQLSDYKI